MAKRVFHEDEWHPVTPRGPGGCPPGNVFNPCINQFGAIWSPKKTFWQYFWSTCPTVFRWTNVSFPETGLHFSLQSAKSLRNDIPAILTLRPPAPTRWLMNSGPSLCRSACCTASCSSALNSSCIHIHITCNLVRAVQEEREGNHVWNWMFQFYYFFSSTSSNSSLPFEFYITSIDRKGERGRQRERHRQWHWMIDNGQGMRLSWQLKSVKMPLTKSWTDMCISATIRQ